MAMKVGDSKAGPMAEINVTPMADIMIVLLIIFMVVTPLLQKGVDVTLPPATNTKERKDNDNSIVVAIRKDSSTYFGSKRVDNLSELTSLVKQKLEDVPEDQKILFLKADNELEYGEVMKVMDLCREAGIEEVALIAEKKVEG